MNLSLARAVLLAHGVTDDQMNQVTGCGSRRNPLCLKDDTVLNKYAAGALSMVGVMGVVFGTDSREHHAGIALAVKEANR